MAVGYQRTRSPYKIEAASHPLATISQCQSKENTRLQCEYMSLTKIKPSQSRLYTRSFREARKW